MTAAPDLRAHSPFPHTSPVTDPRPVSDNLAATPTNPNRRKENHG